MPYNDYPESVSNNAKRGIELNAKVNNRCATQVGKVRAQQLANREEVSDETIELSKRKSIVKEEAWNKFVGSFSSLWGVLNN